MKMVLLFAILTIINVILQSAHSVCLVKCNKYIASVVNAIAFMVYTIVVVYTASDEISLLAKIIITGVANLIGTYLSLTILQKLRKDKLWRIEATMKKCEIETDVPYSIMDINKDNLMCVVFYCSTQAETLKAKEIIKAHNGKYFITENHAHL